MLYLFVTPPYQVQRCLDIITFNNTVINNSNTGQNLFVLCTFYSLGWGFFICTPFL